MKATIFFVLAAILLQVSTSKEAYSSSNFSDAKDKRGLKDLGSFLTSFFNQYQLHEPKEIISCFNDRTAGVFFKSLYEFHTILIDTNERNNFHLHIEYLKMLALFHTLQDSIKCLIKTKDFTDLLDALKVQNKCPSYLAFVNFLYYQARYEELLTDFQPLIESLDRDNPKGAGIAYSRVVRHTVLAGKRAGVALLGIEAYGNGIASHLDIENPNDSIDCWTNKTSRYYLEFFYKLSSAISKGSWYESPINTHFFWKKEGRDIIMKKIPESTWKCVSESDDNQRMIDRLGVNIYDRSFIDGMLRYVNNHRLHYYLIMRNIKNSFDQRNLIHAGAIYAQFLEDIAESISDEKEPEGDQNEFNVLLETLDM